MRRCVGLGVLLVVLTGARWVYAPGSPPELVACLESCANDCGLETGGIASTAEVVCLRRILAGDPVTCP